MTLLALDLNATRLRAVVGPSPRESGPVALEDSETELPLALSLEGRSPEVGRAGTALCRRSPHLACTGFLPHLGGRREWSGPRLRLDAAAALTLFLEHAADRCGRHQVAATAVPGYLRGDQLALLQDLAVQARLKMRGTVDVALAATLAAHSQQPWNGVALVADVDDHALTWSAVIAEGGSARVLQTQPQPTLGLDVWKERLVGALADAFIRKCRRDPRDSAAAEQSLYDQLDWVLRGCQEFGQAEVTLQTPQWQNNLVLSAQDLTSVCAALRERAVTAFTGLSAAVARLGTPRAVVLTAAVGRLPGLAPALETLLGALAVPLRPPESEDFGENLLREDAAPASLRLLDDDAVCQAVHELAALLQAGSLTPGHLEAVPLADEQPPAAGAARLQFRGQEHVLDQAIFSLGRDPRCDLSFDTGEFPSVSGKHCEIVCEQRGFLLVDRSRHGTLVNNRPVSQQRLLQPGDWIRLGPGGPLVRFLGQVHDERKLMPTA